MRRSDLISAWVVAAVAAAAIAFGALAPHGGPAVPPAGQPNVRAPHAQAGDTRDDIAEDAWFGRGGAVE